MFARPTGIAVTPQGDLLVVDTLGCRVVEMSPTGAIGRAFGRRGSGPGEFNYPTDIAVARDGRIFVVDAMNARVQIFDGTAASSASSAATATARATSTSRRAWRSTPTGTCTWPKRCTTWCRCSTRAAGCCSSSAAAAAPPGEFSLPSAVHIDAANRIFVADALNGRVQVFQYVSQPDAR